MTHNRLAAETSPYLLQHADNPVHWYAWGEDALAAAREQERPILLSIGYAACHWCHVMAHESFEDPAIAGVMNKLFVNVKVDREERPDLDAIYQQALALMGEHGGWPLTMFCTPDGRPFWGGTYFPPTARWGRPGFPDLLRHIAGVYRDEHDKVLTNTSAILDAIERLARPEPGDPMSEDDIATIVRHMADAVDTRHGGFGDAPKFPRAPILRLMWTMGEHARIPEARQAVTLSLDRMAQGGIYDHLGGGFARYSTDAAWLVPHFEKMLYDNAQLIELYTMARRSTGEPLFADRVAETVGWVLREMTDASGGFYATLDADSEGEEGRFYVWDETELREVLGTDFDLFAATYDIRPGGNWEGRTILNRSTGTSPRDDDSEARLAAARERLFAARSRRVRPGLDDKILADWNGLMIAALADAAMAFDRPDWLAASRRAFDFVFTHMVRTEMSGALRLIHSWRDGDGRAAGNLDDHAQMARAALVLHDATGDPACLRFAQSLVDVLNRFFADEDDAAYHFTPADAGDVIARTRSATDNATPSGNAVMVEVLARLNHLTGETRYRARADAILRVFSGEARKNPFGFGTLLTGQLFLEAATQVVIRGHSGEAGTIALSQAARHPAVPLRIVHTVAPGEHLPDGHPAAGKDQIDGRATGYVCRGQVCSRPVTSPDALLHELTS